VPELATIAAASYRASFLTIVGEEGLAARSQTHFERRFAEQWPSVTLAQLEDGRVAGFSQVRKGKLDMLFVHPDFFGLSYGASLPADAENRGATHLDCFRDNHAARRFYERQGWRIQGEFIQEFAGGEFASVTYRKP
jgi:putative acetyltransferase